MSLVRNDQSAAYLRDAVALDLGEIAEEGRTLIAKAKREAERLVSDAQQEVDHLLAVQQEEGFRQGREEGYREGFGQGVEAGRIHAIAQMSSDIETALQSWNEALVHFRSVQERLQQEAKRDVLKLALDMGEKIVYRMTESDPTIIETQLEETIHLLATKTKVKIQVNPNDLETAQMILPSLLEQSEQCDELAVIADGSIHPGGCFVRAETGDIDAQIETQVRRIVETLLPRGDQESGDDSANRDEIEAASPAGQDRLARGDGGGDTGQLNTGLGSGDSAQSTLVDSFLSDVSGGNSGAGTDHDDSDVEDESSDQPDETEGVDDANGDDGS